MLEELVVRTHGNRTHTDLCVDFLDYMQLVKTPNGWNIANAPFHNAGRREPPRTPAHDSGSGRSRSARIRSANRPRMRDENSAQRDAATSDGEAFAWLNESCPRCGFGVADVQPDLRPYRTPSPGATVEPRQRRGIEGTHDEHQKD